MSVDLVAEIDRAVLELPEDLQVVWMRFRHLAVLPFHRTIEALQASSPAIRLFSWSGRMDFGEYAFAADLYWPTGEIHCVSGSALEVAYGITEFFREKTA